MKIYDPAQKGFGFQGDVIFAALPDSTKISKDLAIRQSQKGYIELSEGEGAGHFHGIYPQPVHFRPDDIPAGAITTDNLAIGTAKLYSDDSLLNSLGWIEDKSLVIGFLAVENGPVVIQHTLRNGSKTGEHDDLVLLPGLYYVGNQREMDANEIRRVQD